MRSPMDKAICHSPFTDLDPGLYIPGFPLFAIAQSNVDPFFD